MTRAIIFDMDGVLVDTERFIAEAAIRFLRERGVEARPADFLPFVGTGENRFIGGVAETYGLHLDLADAKRRTYELSADLVTGAAELGRLLYTDYVYAFELAAVILLVAIVAAIALTLRRRKDSKFIDPAEQVKVKRNDRLRIVKMQAEKGPGVRGQDSGGEGA